MPKKVTTKSKRSCKSVKIMGTQEPSERVAPKYSMTDGPDATAILRIGGLILDPWQSDVLDDWMAMNPASKWVCKTCGGSVPRQNGKTGLVQGRISAGMLLYNEQAVYTAHLQKTSTETFEELANFFDSPKIRKYLLAVKTALGREQIILKSGARVKFLARTRNGGRGQHGDLLIFDEAQELDDSTQASFIPAISASLNPQTIYVGTPPDENCPGGVFRGIRDKALDHKTKSTAWFEFSVKEIGDTSDITRWADTNPALGRRILLETIASEHEQMSVDTFARERLGWWSPVAQEREDLALSAKAWDECGSEEPKPEGKTAFGVKFSADGSEVSLCGAVLDPGGIARVSLVDRRSTGEGIQWLADWLNERYKQASCVVIDGKNGVSVLVDKIKPVWKAKSSVMRPSVKDMIGAVSTLVNAVNQKELTWYKKQKDFRESAVTSVKRPMGGGWGFGGENSTPIEAASLALWGVKNCKRNPLRKMRIG